MEFRRLSRDSVVEERGRGTGRRRRHGIAGNERQDALSLYVRVRNEAYGVSTRERSGYRFVVAAVASARWALGHQ